MTSSKPRRRINVLGAGVVGLSCACELARDHDVVLIAEKFGVETASASATAIWHLYLVPETVQVLAWAERTLSRLLELGRSCSEAGVSLIEGVELFRRGEQALPTWAHLPPTFEFLTPHEVCTYNRLDRSVASHADIMELERHPVLWGYRLQAPVVSMDTYLPWLETVAHSRNVGSKKTRVNHLAQAADDCDALINCSGLGARELANDGSFVPYKGQYFILKASESAPISYIGDDDHPRGMSYVIPRAGEVLLGGTAEANSESLDLTLQWDELIRRASLYVPWLRDQKATDQSRPPVVCIRPARRDGVRVELDFDSCKIPVVHNYGHGGSGFSLSWGCAESVSTLLDEIF